MFNYYYRDENDAEVIIQMTGNKEKPLSIRVTEDDGSATAVINLPKEEINFIISALQNIK